MANIFSFLVVLPFLFYYTLVSYKLTYAQVLNSEVDNGNKTECQFPFGTDQYYQNYSRIAYNKTIPIDEETNYFSITDFPEYYHMNKSNGHMIFYVCVDILNLDKQEINNTKVTYNPVHIAVHLSFNKTILPSDNVKVHVFAKDRGINTLIPNQAK